MALHPAMAPTVHDCCACKLHRQPVTILTCASNAGRLEASLAILQMQAIRAGCTCPLAYCIGALEGLAVRAPPLTSLDLQVVDQVLLRVGRPVGPPSEAHEGRRSAQDLAQRASTSREGGLVLLTPGEGLVILTPEGGTCDPDPGRHL